MLFCLFDYIFQINKNIEEPDYQDRTPVFLIPHAVELWNPLALKMHWRKVEGALPLEVVLRAEGPSLLAPHPFNPSARRPASISV